MIQEFRIRPHAQNKNATYAVLACAAGAAVCFGISYGMTLYKGVFQLACVFFLVTMMLVYLRYVSSYYMYEVTFDSDGAPIFVVCQCTGKKISTLCRVLLSNVKEVRRLEGEDKTSYRTPYGVPKYIYTPSLAPKSVLLMTVRSSEEKADIFLEGTDEFAKTILSYAEQASADAAEAKENED